MPKRPATYWQHGLGGLLAVIGIFLGFKWALVTPQPVKPEAVLEEMRAEVARRPTWPYAWMRLASALAQYGEYGSELDDALRRTELLGQHEAALYLHRAVMALQHLQAPLPAASREILQASLRHERQEHLFLIQAYVYLYGRDREYCGQEDLKVHEQAWCRGIQKSRTYCRDRRFFKDIEHHCSKSESYHAQFLNNWRFWLSLPQETSK